MGRDPQGNPVLAASAPIPALGWVVLVEQPLAEAYAPLYAAMGRTAVLAFGAVVLAVLASLALARHVTLPIRALQEGAARIGAGALDHRLEVKTGDELQALAEEFNHMAARLCGILRGPGAQGGRAHPGAGARQPGEVAPPARREPRPAPAAARPGALRRPVRRARPPTPRPGISPRRPGPR